MPFQTKKNIAISSSSSIMTTWVLSMLMAYFSFHNAINYSIGSSSSLFADAFTIQSTHTWSGIRNQVYNPNNQQYPTIITTITTSTTIRQQQQQQQGQNRKHSGRIGSCCLYMRDASASYWFQVGDTIKVVKDVYKGGINLKNRHGTVIETWEKCDVDPTCCCAEQVDIGMAVRVKFMGTIDQAEETTTTNTTMISTTISNICDDTKNDNDPFFLHYFAESELEKVKEIESSSEMTSSSSSSSSVLTTTMTTATTNASENQEQTPAVVAFDGQSCVAFKLDQLKMGKQAQRLAAFEASRDASIESE